ncbi:uncharacterized protein LOC134288701 [Aedes albopictus]|uniref:CCHC-type domain-containing protein n=1 Tax=Aedes albopictus TaxID=7160 RepID=A0ABM1YUJ4_AEDAL
MIENTIKFRFPASAPRPTWIEIADFLKQLKSNVMHMETVYKMEEDRSLSIKFKTAVAMEEALRLNSGPVKFCYSNGKTVHVTMSRAGTNVRYVRIFDIPPEVSDEDLSLVLGKYGKIESVIREKLAPNLGLGHMFNGVRGLHIDVESEIPPTVEILQWKGKVFYDDLKNKCFLCQQEGHRKNACPQRPTRNQKAKGVEMVASTYASAVIHGGVALAQQEAVNEEKEVVKEDSEAKAEADEGEKQGTLQGTEPIVYQSEYEKTLAENWAKHEAEKRKRQEEYRKQEKSMQRRYQENLRAKEAEQKERWEKCEAERRSRQEKFNRESSQQQQVLPAESLLQSPPKKNARKQ